MRFTPTFTVDDFIEYYKDQMSLIRKYSENVLLVRFENLIYEYDSEVSKIENFLGISSHNKPKKYFDPAISIANTQMSLRFPKLEEDIKKIEEKLPDYLYPFDESRADLKAKMWVFKKEED